MATDRDEMCPRRVHPHDISAWLLDDQPLPAGIDEQHIRSCPACTRVARAMTSTRRLGETLAVEIAAPAQTVERAVQRVRIEMIAGEVLGTFLDAVAAVTREALASEHVTREEP